MVGILLISICRMDLLFINEEWFDDIRQIIGDLYVWVYMDQSNCGCDASFPPSRYQYYY